MSATANKYARQTFNLGSFEIILRFQFRQRHADYVPEVLAAQERPASLKAASPLIVARRMPHRNMATGSMPMSCRTYARSLLLNNATMSGRMWSVFFSRKSWRGRVHREHYELHHEVALQQNWNLFAYVRRPYLDLIFNFPSKVLDDEGGLHDRCGDKVFVSLVLLLEFG